MIINICDIYIRENKGFNVVHIKKHPYYISIKKRDKELYKNYVNKSYYQKKKKTANWNEFIKLYYDIKNNGYNNKRESIVIKKIDGKWVCVHGRHRMCMLRVIHKNLFLEFDSRDQPHLLKLIKHDKELKYYNNSKRC